MKSKQPLFTVRQLAVCGVMLAAIEAAKLTLAGIPNIELVTLLMILFTRAIGKKMYLVALAFVGVEAFIWGGGPWVASYAYIWPLLVFFALRIREDNVWLISAFSGLFGLMFGALCAIPYLVLSGAPAAFAWWVAGIPWDIAHAIGNFVLCRLLFVPLEKAISQALAFSGEA